MQETVTQKVLFELSGKMGAPKKPELPENLKGLDLGNSWMSPTISLLRGDNSWPPQGMRREVFFSHILQDANNRIKPVFEGHSFKFKKLEASLILTGEEESVNRDVLGCMFSFIAGEKVYTSFPLIKKEGELLGQIEGEIAPAISGSEFFNIDFELSSFELQKPITKDFSFSIHILATFDLTRPLC